MESEVFEPKIVAFCCHYCAYSSADLAGSMRIQYPPNVRIIRTPCTGRLETEYFMKAFENGADGVLIAGCLEGGCHFVEGNLRAKRRVNYIKQMLEEVGMEKERLRMVNVSAAMARPLADNIIDMVETVRKLGPSPIRLRSGSGGQVRLRPDLKENQNNAGQVQHNGLLKQEICS
jgi:coenzyme F420-reducing hydrogenase delta subunit